MKVGDLVVAIATRHDNAFISGHIYKIKAIGDTWLDVELDSNGQQSGWGKAQFILHVPPKKSIIERIFGR